MQWLQSVSVAVHHLTKADFSITSTDIGISNVAQVNYLAEPPGLCVPTKVTLYINNNTGATTSLQLTCH